MGVLPTTKLPAKPEKIEQYLEDYLYESLDESEDDSNTVISAPPTPNLNRRQRRKCRPLHYPSVKEGCVSQKQGLGSRKMRRLENARFLTALVDSEDICEDLSDMLPTAISAFTQLFLEQDSMKAWTDFIGKSEEEQDRFLQQGHSADHSKTGYTLAGPSSSSAAASTPRRCQQNHADRRQGHPAYSAEECFRRVDGRFRHLLAQKHLPLGMIDRFEVELTDFFNAIPDGVWLRRFESGYERLLLHAVAQYLSLKSKSYGPEGGGAERETTVENEKAFFVPPQDSLANYLERRRQGANNAS